MSSITIWNTLEKQSVRNAEIAASGTEFTIEAPNREENWNMALVQNFDANSDIDVLLDDNINPTETFFCQSNGGAVNIGPDIPVNFKRLFLKNRNSGEVVAAGSVNVRVAVVAPAQLTDELNISSATGNTNNQYGFILS